MKSKNRWMVIAWLLLVAGTPGLLALDDGQKPSDQPPAKSPSLDGAKVFAWNCGSCHSERYPSERKDAAWDKIATHMRVRANLTADQTAAVLHYLKENN